SPDNRRGIINLTFVDVLINSAVAKQAVAIVVKAASKLSADVTVHFVGRVARSSARSRAPDNTFVKQCASGRLKRFRSGATTTAVKAVAQPARDQAGQTALSRFAGSSRSKAVAGVIEVIVSKQCALQRMRAQVVAH